MLYRCFPGIYLAVCIGIVQEPSIAVENSRVIPALNLNVSGEIRPQNGGVDPLSDFLGIRSQARPEDEGATRHLLGKIRMDSI